MHIGTILESLADHTDLSHDEARDIFTHLLTGKLTPAQAGGLLIGLRMKGETAQELHAAVQAAVNQARLVPDLTGVRIDTCGTGGDKSCSFNCSTAVSLILAGMGYQVVKHGNRAISSHCGSADVIEALNMSITLGPEEASRELVRNNFVFLFAPHYHPAFKHVMPVRKELGCRTLFNLMGPLLNPARPTHQLLGVANTQIMPLMAEVLALGGIERAAVVHGTGGFDELTPFGPAEVIWVRKGTIESGTIDPEALGIATHSPEDVAVANKDQAVAVLKDILAGKGHPAMVDMVVFNLAVALHLLEDIGLEEGVERARKGMADGAGRKFLHA